MFANLIDRVIEASLRRAQRREKVEQLKHERPLLASTDGPPPTSRTRQFTVHDAMNGTYIEFMKRKYNPNGPDEYQREVYVVQPDESLVDAISTILVLTEK